MAHKARPPYPADFGERLDELVKTGVTAAQLLRDFGCPAQTVANWSAQAAHPKSEVRAADRPLSDRERRELNRLRRENHQLKLEREILSKASAWFAAGGAGPAKRSGR